jgi:purine-cytosine permease-like protein
MSSGLDLAPVPLAERRSTLLDVALLFAGANIVSTTLVTGGSLAGQTSLAHTWSILICGILLGTAPIAMLARLGPRTGLPSMVLLRQPFGGAGAAAVSLLLVLTNFAWIALNNLIAARALAPLFGGHEALWSLAVGAAATLIAFFCPRVMALFDRVAVPLLGVVGLGLTVALLRGPRVAAASDGGAGFFTGLDLVAGYQVSWSLMFADYTRYQRSETKASLAVLLGLSVSSLWLLAVGAFAARAGGSNDPAVMIQQLGLPLVALLLIALSTITTNFVNLYLSALAVKNLWPRAPETGVVISIGALGTSLGLLRPGLLDRYAAFMEVLGTLLLPIVAIALAHFFLRAPTGTESESKRGLRSSAVLAWLLGVIVYQGVRYLLPQLGATIPTLMVSALSYLVADRARRLGRIERAPRGPRTAA